LTFSSPLRRNSEGPEVAQLQQRLRELGYFAYPENSGQFGALTEAAVMSFQADRGLPTTGLAGPQTISALNNCDAACARSNTGEEVAP
jgi:peptidoglycan hydrolase-like protein with peptidoglycan-binding domain